MGIGAAQTLSQAIELILAHDEQATIAAASAHEKANELGDIFEQRMQARIEGRSESSPLPRELFNPNLQSLQDQIQGAQDRERAFLDAFEAQMELSSSPANQANCSFVFDRLRLAKEAGWETLLEVPAIDRATLATDPSQDPEKRKREMLKPFLGFHEQMRARLERRRDEQGDAAAKCRVYLEEALVAAQRMHNTEG